LNDNKTKIHIKIATLHLIEKVSKFTNNIIVTNIKAWNIFVKIMKSVIGSSPAEA